MLHPQWSQVLHSQICSLESDQTASEMVPGREAGAPQALPHGAQPRLCGQHGSTERRVLLRAMWPAFLLWSWRFSECMVPGAVDPRSSCCSCCDLARTQTARGCEQVLPLPGHLLQAPPDPAWPGCPESPGRTLLLGRRSCQMGAPSLKQALADSLEKGGWTDG